MKCGGPAYQVTLLPVSYNRNIFVAPIHQHEESIYVCVCFLSLKPISQNPVYLEQPYRQDRLENRLIDDPRRALLPVTTSE